MDAESLSESPMYQELCRQVHRELARLENEQPDQATALENQRKQIEQEQSGRLRSIAKVDLPASVRAAVEQDFEHAQARLLEITGQLNSLEVAKRQVQEALDPGTVATELNKLHETIARTNASATNMMLAHHIEGIWCRRDQTVVIRTCKLGALSGAINLMRRTNIEPLPVGLREEGRFKGTPRRRTKLDVGDVFEDDEEVEAANFFATDPNRFAGLGPEWFWDDVFEIPPPDPCWSEANAEAIAAERAKGLTVDKLAKMFNVTNPTIRKALKIAKAKNPELSKLPQKMPRARWEEQNFKAVACAKREHPKWQMKDFVEHFGKCETLISRAMKLASDVARSAESGETAGSVDSSSDRQAS